LDCSISSGEHRFSSTDIRNLRLGSHRLPTGQPTRTRRSARRLWARSLSRNPDCQIANAARTGSLPPPPRRDISVRYESPKIFRKDMQISGPRRGMSTG
jgi:hypothetical protein